MEETIYTNEKVLDSINEKSYLLSDTTAAMVINIDKLLEFKDFVYNSLSFYHAGNEEEVELDFEALEPSIQQLENILFSFVDRSIRQALIDRTEEI